jgi:hypothetical protein
VGNAGRLSAMNVNGLSTAASLWIGISYIFLLQPMKPVFCNLKSKFPLNLKIK